MIYSVARPDLTYRYFEGPGTFPPVGAFRKPRGRPINDLFPPRRFLPILPAGSVENGGGPEPRGILAVLPTGVIEGLPEPVKTVGKKLIYAGIGWALKSWWNGRGKRK